jgi:hypothetical protein
MDSRGISRYQFIFTGSSKADRSHAAIVDYVRWCLWKHQSDPNIKKLLDAYDKEIEKLGSEKTECKRCYVSTYGHEEWNEILTNPNPCSNIEYDLINLVGYWKMKVFQQKSWGLRKIFKETSFPIQLRYDLLSHQLKQPDFNQVR